MSNLNDVPIAEGSLRVNAIVQARMTSTRLPGKSMKRLGGLPVLGWSLRALNMCTSIDQVIVATSLDSSDDPIADFCSANGVSVYRGSLDDVLARYLGAIELYPSDAVVRITADCPLISPRIVDLVVDTWRDRPQIDYVSTTIPRSFPRGLDVELAASRTLAEVGLSAKGVDRVHVTSAIYSDSEKFEISGIAMQPDESHLRVTLDTHEDWLLLERVVADLGDRVIDDRELIEYLHANPTVAAINADVRQKLIAEG